LEKRLLTFNGEKESFWISAISVGSLACHLSSILVEDRGNVKPRHSLHRGQMLQDGEPEEEEEEETYKLAVFTNELVEL
jgi:hypothetical protein